MMIIIFKLILITSMLVLGWKIVISEGMLLEDIGLWAQAKVESGNRAYDYIICQWCLPSSVGIIAYAVAYFIGVIHKDVRLAYAYPLVVCGSSILCGFSWAAYTTLNSIREYFENN